VDANESLLYRNGRLMLPANLQAQDAVTVARFLTGVPASDRANAFRALPLSCASAAYLHMPAQAQAELHADLSAPGTHFLLGIASDAMICALYLAAAEDVREMVETALPLWRGEALAADLLAIREATQGKPATAALAAPSRGLRRLLSFTRADKVSAA